MEDINQTPHKGAENNILHVSCFGEALQLVREQLDQKNVYYINPALNLQR